MHLHCFFSVIFTFGVTYQLWPPVWNMCVVSHGVDSWTTALHNWAHEHGVFFSNGSTILWTWRILLLEVQNCMALKLTRKAQPQHQKANVNEGGWCLHLMRGYISDCALNGFAPECVALTVWIILYSYSEVWKKSHAQANAKSKARAKAKAAKVGWVYFQNLWSWSTRKAARLQRSFFKLCHVSRDCFTISWWCSLRRLRWFSVRCFFFHICLGLGEEGCCRG